LLASAEGLHRAETRVLQELFGAFDGPQPATESLSTSSERGEELQSGQAVSTSGTSCVVQDRRERTADFSRRLIKLQAARRGDYFSVRLGGASDDS
jgi:hypothetical protein